MGVYKNNASHEFFWVLPENGCHIQKEFAEFTKKVCHDASASRKSKTEYEYSS